MPPLIIVKKGDRYGRLRILNEVGRNAGRRQFRVQCICGNKLRVLLASIRSGNTQSCGCAKTDATTAMGLANERHGCARRSGASPEYNAWCSMLKRCYNTAHHNYKYYGARGIGVCQRWIESFEAFLEDIGPRPTPDHSLDRENNDGNYEPGNVRWATLSQQNRNKRYPARAKEAA